MGGKYRVRIVTPPLKDDGIELGGCEDFYANTLLECLGLMWKHRRCVIFVTRWFKYRTFN